MYSKRAFQCVTIKHLRQSRKEMNALTNQSSTKTPTKYCLFAKSKKGHVLFLDSKAYLRSGTAVGVRDTSSGNIHDV